MGFVLFLPSASLFSEFLRVPVRQLAAAVSGHVSRHRLHHGLEDEGVQYGGQLWHREEVHRASVTCIPTCGLVGV